MPVEIEPGRRSDCNVLARELLEGFDYTQHWMRWALGTARDLLAGTPGGIRVRVEYPAATCQSWTEYGGRIVHCQRSPGHNDWHEATLDSIGAATRMRWSSSG